MLGLISAPASATTAYITDHIEVALFATADLKGEPMTHIPSGTLVDVLEKGKGITRVKIGSGQEGWLRTTFLTTNLPITIRLEDQEAQVSKLNAQLDNAKAEIKALETEAGKAKDLGWMRGEMNKARDQAKQSAAELDKVKQQLDELKAAQAKAQKKGEAALAEGDTELARLQAERDDLEQRLAATLLINGEIDPMVPEPVAPDWLAALPWLVLGLLLGLAGGFALGYRWLANRIKGRYVKVY